MYNFVNFCIVCFSCDEKLKRLSDIDPDNIRLLKKLEYCSGEKVYENVPHFICNECCNDLSRAYNFKKKVIEMDIKRARNLSNYVKQHVNNDQEVCDEESKNCYPETRRSCDENKETASYTKRKFNDENRETLAELTHTNVDNKNEKNEQETTRLIKQENIEIEEHNVDPDKCIVNKVNKKIKVEEKVMGNKIDVVSVQPLWIVRSVVSVNEIKQEKKDTTTERHMPLDPYRREKDVSDNEGGVYEESDIETDEDFDDEALAKEEMIDISQIAVNERTSDENIYNYDVLTEQQGSLQNHTREKRFACTQCLKRFTTKISLEEHMLIHSNEKPHCCHICNKRFRQKNALRKHIRWHENPEYRFKKYEKVYTCIICQRDFNHQGNLQRHMRMHTGEKPFECTICSVRFTTKYSAKEHMVVHTNEKPFSCRICNKQFKYQNVLRMHVRQHEDPGNKLEKQESVYTCSVCKRDFNHHGNLQRHMRVHTGEKPFYCSECNTRFCTKNSLRDHMLRHTNEKPHPCNICKMMFRHKVSLKKHIRNLHSSPDEFQKTVEHVNDFKDSTESKSTFEHCAGGSNESTECCTAISSDSTAVPSKNSEQDVMESQDGNKDRTHIVSRNMQKRREIYLRENTNATELIVGVPLNETAEEVEDETVVRTVKKIKEKTDQDMIEVAKIADEFNKPLKMKEEKDETEQSEFETVFVSC